MGQETRHRPWDGLWKGAALLAAVCLLVSGFFSGERGVPDGGSVSAAAISGAARQVVPMGRAVGIKLFSDGVLVVGLSEVETAGGSAQPGRECGLKTGDLITHIDGQDVDTIEQVQEMLAEKEGDALSIRAVRGDKPLQLSAKPVANINGGYQLGVWLRDSMAGIGTMTFYEPESGLFAALGHGINDVDTAMLMPLESGGIMEATVSDVKKGLSGQPGELHGAFDLKKDMGRLCANTDTGIFGVISSQPEVTRAPVAVATRKQIEVGPATILSNVRGSEVQEFDIEITHLAPEGEDRAMTLHVTDPELLEATGGIVQGMSGSPILQNGRLVGAVTHVLINDPTRGYGITAERMLDEAAHGGQLS